MTGSYAFCGSANRSFGQRRCPMPSGKDEFYTYDQLNRLVWADRGDLTGTPYSGVTNRSFQQAWGLTPTGNWADFQQDTNGDGDFTDAADLDQDRTHNLVNEITGITEQSDPQQSQWIDPVHDARGNMTTIPKPADLTAGLTGIYDAWNRLVEVKDGQYTIGRYEYDGTNRRIKKHIDTQAPSQPNGVDTWEHFYYNSSWQLLETRSTTAGENTEPEGVQPQYQWVWSMRYIDAPVLRDANTDTDGLCDDERIYFTTDANMNVTALLDTDGTVLERYMYDAYGKVTVLDADWSADADGVSDYANAHLFAGYYRDFETGLSHVRHRFYPPTLGRWLQRDPVERAQDTSLYEYSRGRVTIAVDPGGTPVLAHRRMRRSSSFPARRLRARLCRGLRPMALRNIPHLLAGL